MPVPLFVETKGRQEGPRGKSFVLLTAELWKRSRRLSRVRSLVAPIAASLGQASFQQSPTLRSLKYATAICEARRRFWRISHSSRQRLHGVSESCGLCVTSVRANQVATRSFGFSRQTHGAFPRLVPYSVDHYSCELAARIRRSAHAVDFWKANMNFDRRPVLFAATAYNRKPISKRSELAVGAALDCDPEGWKLFAINGQGASFDSWWTSITAQIKIGQWVAYAIRDLATDEIVGTSSFLNIKRDRSSVEIGGTFLHPRVRSGHTNPEFSHRCWSMHFRAGREGSNSSPIFAMNEVSLPSVSSAQFAKEFCAGTGRRGPGISETA